MKYTLTRIDPDALPARYPMEKKETVEDPLSEQINRSVFMGKLEDVLHSTVNWGVRTPYGLTTSACHAVMWK